MPADKECYFVIMVISIRPVASSHFA